MREMFPWMQFAVNPRDVPQYTKVELQGMVAPEGALMMLDASVFLPWDLGHFSELRAQGETTAMVAGDERGTKERLGHA